MEQDTQPKNYNIIQEGSYNSKESLMYQLENTDIVENVYHSLRCEVPILDETTGQWKWVVPEGVVPLINQRGAESLLVELKARVNKIYILSDLDDDDINTMVNNIAVNVIDEITNKWDLYEIDDHASASRIVSIITDAVYATLRKAKGKNYLTYIGKISQVSEIRHTDMTQKSGGNKFLENFMPGNHG
jgi:hypothetical protein